MAQQQRDRLLDDYAEPADRAQERASIEKKIKDLQAAITGRNQKGRTMSPITIRRKESAMLRCPRCHKSDLAILCETTRTAFVDEEGNVVGGSEGEDGYEWNDDSEAHCAMKGCTWVGTVGELRVKKTCTPYKGRFTAWQQEALLTFLFPHLPKVPGVDQVITGIGSKTATGLLLTIESICFPKGKRVKK